jgi:hypothetical protein
MSKNYFWTKTDDNGFVNEISQFKGEYMITLPDGYKLSLSWFTPVHDPAENELIYWETVYRGVKYTLFND